MAASISDMLDDIFSGVVSGVVGGGFSGVVSGVVGGGFSVGGILNSDTAAAGLTAPGTLARHVRRLVCSL